jgi:hypothetical protein
MVGPVGYFPETYALISRSTNVRVLACTAIWSSM